MPPTVRENDAMTNIEIIAENLAQVGKSLDPIIGEVRKETGTDPNQKVAKKK